MVRSVLALAARLLLPMLLVYAPALEAADAAPDPTQRQALINIRDAALQSNWGYLRLEDLADLIGPRLSGSPAADAAVEQIAADLTGAGISVRLEPVTVPHWVRGAEEARLVEYAGRPAGISQKVVLTALGNSAATPSTGLDAQIVVIQDFAELERRKDEVMGRIVLFNQSFDQSLADNGYAGTAYGKSVRYRYAGPSRAAQLGAVAALVRTAGNGNFRLPHTGETDFADGAAPIPAAAVSYEDALLIDRLSRRGAPVMMHLTLTPVRLADVESHNVIGEIVGTDASAGIVIVSGHLDSWDLGTGAMDDGIGVVSAMAALQIIRQLDLHPRRTIRFVAWMDEENGTRGAKAYGRDHHDELVRHMAAIESDFGLGPPLGVATNASAPAFKALRDMIDVLAPIGAVATEDRAQPMGSDLNALQSAGVPIYEPIVDGRHYFDYHHSAADTFDKVEPENFKKQVAVMAVLSYFLANSDPPIARAALPFQQN